MLFLFYIFLFSTFPYLFVLGSTVKVQERGRERGCGRTKLRHPSSPTKGKTVTEVETKPRLSAADTSSTAVEEG